MTFGYKSFRIFGPNIWNKLPYYIKSSENLKSFKELIEKNRDGTSRSCDICEQNSQFLPFFITLLFKSFTKKFVYTFITY